MSYWANTPKPTGVGKIPDYIEWSREIELEMANRAGIVYLNNGSDGEEDWDPEDMLLIEDYEQVGNEDDCAGGHKNHAGSDKCVNTHGLKPPIHTKVGGKTYCKAWTTLTYTWSHFCSYEIWGVRFHAW
jgi:hypothetical protein